MNKCSMANPLSECGVQMCYTMRAQSDTSWHSLGSTDQVQNPSGWCVRVSITELIVPRQNCFSATFPPLPLLRRKGSIPGLHQNALILSSTALSISVWEHRGARFFLPSLEEKLSTVSISHVPTPGVHGTKPHDENSAHIPVHHKWLIANKNIHLHPCICLSFKVLKVKVYSPVVSTLHKKCNSRCYFKMSTRTMVLVAVGLEKLQNEFYVGRCLHC